MNVPEVPAGADGTVVKTTLFGRPKQVHFSLQTAWGPKEFVVSVQRGDVVSDGYAKGNARRPG